MTPEQLMLVWAATYAAEYVRCKATNHLRLEPREASIWAREMADNAAAEIQLRDITPFFEGYEKL